MIAFRNCMTRRCEMMPFCPRSVMSRHFLLLRRAIEKMAATKSGETYDFTMGSLAPATHTFQSTWCNRADQERNFAVPHGGDTVSHCKFQHNNFLKKINLKGKYLCTKAVESVNIGDGARDTCSVTRLTNKSTKFLGQPGIRVLFGPIECVTACQIAAIVPLQIMNANRPCKHSTCAQVTHAHDCVHWTDCERSVTIAYTHSEHTKL